MGINKTTEDTQNKEMSWHKHFEDALGNLQCVLVARRTLMNPDGVTWPQYDTLYILHQLQPMTPSAIGDKLGFARSKMSKILRALKDTGFVEQMSGENDKREMLTKLTEKGVNFLNEAESARHSMARQVASCMSPGEIAIFTELCMKAAHVLDQDIKDGKEK
ncbi:MarR family transcriptional regulator [Serratia sp. NPDC078593]|uniref:MarR family transcriptional regulator n=1 Tax=unclassified Serratia (in: enterobacteria) TaxID=2647522 RepID=UPI0037D49C87